MQGGSALCCPAQSANKKLVIIPVAESTNAHTDPQRGLLQHSIRVLRGGCVPPRDCSRGSSTASVGPRAALTVSGGAKGSEERVELGARAIGRRLAARMARGATAVRAGGGGRPSIGARHAAHETRASDARAAARSETHRPLRSGAPAAGNRPDRGVGPEIPGAAPGRVLRYRLPPHHADGGDAAADPAPLCGEGCAALRVSRVVVHVPGARARADKGIRRRGAAA